jgi:hypothetical protein
MSVLQDEKVLDLKRAIEAIHKKLEPLTAAQVIAEDNKITKEVWTEAKTVTLITLGDISSKLNDSPGESGTKQALKFFQAYFALEYYLIATNKKIMTIATQLQPFFLALAPLIHQAQSTLMPRFKIPIAARACPSPEAVRTLDLFLSRHSALIKEKQVHKHITYKPHPSQPLFDSHSIVTKANDRMCVLHKVFGKPVPESTFQMQYRALLGALAMFTLFEDLSSTYKLKDIEFITAILTTYFQFFHSLYNGRKWTKQGEEYGSWIQKVNNCVVTHLRMLEVSTGYSDVCLNPIERVIPLAHQGPRVRANQYADCHLSGGSSAS